MSEILHNVNSQPPTSYSDSASRPGHEFNPQDSKRSETAGYPIHYVVQGQGPPVILIHGMAASLSDWEMLLPALASAGYRAYALDLPGHGNSHKPNEPEHYHSKAVLAALESWIESLGLDQPPILVGHSLGGYLSLRYALRHPLKLRAQVLIDPLYSPRQLSPLVRLLNHRPAWSEKALQALPQWLVSTVMSLDTASMARFSGQARRQIAADLKRASPHILYIPHTVRDLTPRLGEVPHKTLVIWGENDLTLSPGSFSRLVEALAGASGRALPACGHQPHIGQPEVVNRLVLEFLKQIP